MPADLALPVSLNRQFDSLERRLWRNETLLAAAGGLGSLLLACALEFASDRVWDTPQWLRALIALCGWSGLMACAWRYGCRWVWKRRSIRALAVIVQRRHPRLGDRLLGIVELADPASRPSQYSPELCHAAIAQVAGEASAFDFEEAVEGRSHGRWVRACAATAVVLAITTLGAPEAMWNAAARWLLPMSAIPRYTFVSLEPLPDEMAVAEGEPFDLNIRLASRSAWRPREAEARFAGETAVEALVAEGGATFHFPGQTEERLLLIRVGDATRSLHIHPAIRADLLSMTATLDFPGYLQYPREVRKIESGSLDFLPGTMAQFSGEAARPLSSASQEGDASAPVAVDGAQFTTRRMLLETAQDFTFTWRDALGLAGAGPAVIHATPLEDQPPEVDMQGLEAAIAVLPEETIPITLEATDDYGVRRLSLAWESTAPGLPGGTMHELLIAEGQPQARKVSGHYALSPALLHLEPDTTLLVRGLAVDYFPDRQPSSSAIHRIHVLSREAHADLIRDQFEKLMDQLEDLTRRQGEIEEAGKALRARAPEELAAADSTGQLSAQSQDQTGAAATLKDLAAGVAGTVAEALRNPEISPDILKAWASRAEEMNQLALTAMPSAARSLAAAAADPGQRRENLDAAEAQQAAILKALREMGAEGAGDLDRLLAETLTARLRRAAATEREIAEGFAQMLPETIGMTPDELGDEARGRIEAMGANQSAVSADAARLTGEIARLFARTSLERDGQVAREMEGLKAAEALAALGGLMEKNIGVRTIAGTRYWSGLLDGWAARLSDGDKARSSAKQPPVTPDGARLQALLALMRMRQEQDQLRQQTAALDAERERGADYQTAARDIGGRQSSLGGGVRVMENDPSSPVPTAELPPIAGAMDDAAALLAKPDTGEPARAAQTDAINLLDALIAQQAQAGGAGTSALAGMMGMGAGSGGMTGGRDREPTLPTNGSTIGAAPGERRVNQAAGMDDAALPAEFRDAIENYHRTMEKRP